MITTLILALTFHVLLTTSLEKDFSQTSFRLSFNYDLKETVFMPNAPIRYGLHQENLEIYGNTDESNYGQMFVDVN